MEKYISNMPVWGIVLFIITFVIMIAFIARPARQVALIAGMPIAKAQSIQWGIFIFFALWLAYTSVLSLRGALSVNSLPPRVVVYTAIPLVIILFGIIANTGLYKRLVQAAPLETLVRMHVFRFEGIIFILLYLGHLLPRDFAISAGMGDILTALFSIPVARAISQKKPWSIKAAYAWNIFGILDIVTLMTLAVVAANNAILTGQPGITEMAMFPISWFPAFAPATILFLHFGIFKKLQQIKRESVSTKFVVLS